MTHAATLTAAPRAGIRAAAAVVALIGLGIATYLTVVHYAGGTPVCAIAHGCATVQKSHYAELFGLPVALLGGLAYLGILAALVRDDEDARTAAAGLAIVGLGFSAWLTYVEVFQLHAICIWCVGSAVCMALLAPLTVARLLRAPPPAPRRGR
jgi:uncharacterized membrane protein